MKFDIRSGIHKVYLFNRNIKSKPIYQAFLLLFLIQLVCFNFLFAQNPKATNPIIHADVPDLSMVRVGDTYYMSSTTMHMSPGVPIMKSKDLVNWEIVNYAYDILDAGKAMGLENGENGYGRGSWASSLRYHNGTYYVMTFAKTTGKTHVYTTKNIEKGPWKSISFPPSLHDLTLFFEEYGKVYLIWGAGTLKILELEPDLSGIKPGTERVLIENATAPAGDNVGLPAEGSQLFKVNGKYYLFNIAWPKGGMRTVIVHRADNINGPYEGKVMLQDKGVAQGGLINTTEGDWYAYLFRDYGAVGRIPYLVPVKWEDGWPVMGTDGLVPDFLDLSPNKSLLPGIVASDDFERNAGDKELPLVWQWNHNPVREFWSLDERKGFLRLKTSRVDDSFLTARNTLTQRTVGPESSGEVMVDVSNMKEGDFAGLGLLQRDYGTIGISFQNGRKNIVMKRAENGSEIEIQSIRLLQETIYLKAVCDFKNKIDKARFYYSLDGNNWIQIGDVLQMKYTLPHFMGYRFALFNYATKEAGGQVDFDYFKINVDEDPLEIGN
ncbi:glycoside hydrolase 43 family protein [Aquiflexum gelatinilyticum]|uniref:Glycoside hydrolase 43 family protein n=1 Tax=Aquiflexum gelatinilyticum TaxID=2961943 RepID=A0A9X2P6S6_9BACT|nr:glycoside hydrolase 43 family protein [Aquiflexum gelatinilyticum]MCR9014159.1 glycoside hydrolase 43 family protein [Aquiflexum gelatinilyticum]